MPMGCKRLLCLTLSILLVLSLSWSAVASVAIAPTPDVPWFGDDAEVVPLNDEELAEVSGDANPIVVGAIGGAIGGAVAYLTSPGDKTVEGLLWSAGIGAVAGTVGSTFRTLATVAQGGKAVVSGVTAIVEGLAAAAEGALAGALSHLRDGK